MADKIVAEYIVKTDKAVAELNRVVGRLDAIDKERKQTQDGFKDMSKGMAADFKKVGAAIGLAFGAQELISFGKEAVKLASQMEGVERAFKRIGGANSANLLDGLRSATRGTVSDIKLMTTAIQSANFQIPLENLAKYMQFAQQRARETGKSVDYLIESILTGVGRGSIEVWDNMGFSLTRVREKLNGVSIESLSVADRAKLMSDLVNTELEKMGDQADTTADKLEKIGAAMDNIKVFAGEALINFGTGLLYLTGQIDTGIEATDGLVKAAENLADIYENDVAGAVDKMLEKNKELLDNQLKIAELEETRGYQNSRKAINVINEAIEKLKERNIFLREYVKQLKAIYDASQQQDVSEKKLIKNLFYYNNLIKELREEQADTNTTRARVRELEDEINEAIRQRLLLLGKLRKVGGATYEQIESNALTELETQQTLTDDILADYAHRNGEIEAAIKERNAMEAALAEERADAELEFAKRAIAEVTSIFRSISQIQANLVQEEMNSLREQLEQGAITREQYEEKRKALLRQQAEDAKAAAIFEATINGAVAVVSAFKDGGPVLAALVGAAVVAEIAAISSQPLPQFAEGGFVNEHGEIIGRSHAQGGVLIEAEGNEFITKGKYAQQNADILRAINSGEWEKYKMENIIAPAINQVLEGGFGGMGASFMLNGGFNDKNLLRAIDRHRTSDKDGFVYLANELKRLKPRRRGGFN